MSTYGYCRISTKKQSIARQKRNILQQYPDAIIVTEIYTRTDLENRKEFNKLLNKLKPNDTLVFDSVSRMSGESEEGFNLYKDLFDKKINLVFLKEPHINTECYKKALQTNIQMTNTNVDIILKAVNEYLMILAEEQIRIALDQSEKEVKDLRQRTKEGIETARLNGKQIGLKKGSKLTTKKSLVVKAKMKKHCKDFGGSLNDKEMIAMLGIHRVTYYKYKREMKEGID